MENIWKEPTEWLQRTILTYSHREEGTVVLFSKTTQGRRDGWMKQ